jgi:hypothetical protein
MDAHEQLRDMLREAAADALERAHELLADTQRQIETAQRLCTQRRETVRSLHDQRHQRELASRTRRGNAG